MFVFIDVNQQNIILFTDNGPVSIPFSSASDLFNYVNSEKIMYITEVVEATPEDVINVAYSAMSETPAIDRGAPGATYLCSVFPGSVVIPGVELKFENKYDIKILDEKLQQMIDNSVTLQSLIKQGKLKFINDNEKNILFVDKKQNLKKEVERQNRKDKKLDSIIIEGKVEDWDGTIQDDEHDAIVIDLGKE